MEAVRGCSEEVIEIIKRMHPGRIMKSNPPADTATSAHLFLKKLYGGDTSTPSVRADRYFPGDPGTFVIKDDLFSRNEYRGKTRNPD